MPIETPSGVLEVENAKLRASSIEATIAVGIGTESNDAYPLQVFKETEPDIRIQEGSTISSASRIYSNNSNLYIQTGSNFTSGSSGDVAFQTMQGASTHMVIKGDGNVGIGTTNPQGLLHLSSGTSGDCNVILEADTDNNNEGDNPSIIFKQDGTLYEGMIGLDGTNNLHLKTAVAGGGAIKFSTINRDETTIGGLTSNAVERMTITKTGNVGIGTASPGQKLHVNGAITATHMSLGSTRYPTLGGNWLSIFSPTFDGNIGDNHPDPDGGILFTNQSSNQKFPWGYYMGVVKDVATTNPSSLRFDIGRSFDLNSDGSTGGADTLTPDFTLDNGNVGIGTTDPTCQLTIDGGTGINSSGGVLGIRQKGDTLNDGITFTSSHSNSTRLYKDGSGHFYMYNTGGGTFTFQNVSGNVGIGTASPGTTLDVNGMATIRNQPGFQAWKTGFQLSSVTGSNGHIDGWSEQFDVNGDFNASTGIFSAPEDGLYYFSSVFSWDQGDGVDDTLYMLFYIDNNSTYGDRSTSSSQQFRLNPKFVTRSGKEFTTTFTSLERLQTGATVRIYFKNVGTSGNYVTTCNFNGYKAA